MRKLFVGVLLLLLTVGGVTAQDTVAEPEVSPELAAELNEIEQFVIDLRGLEPINEVDRRFPSRITVSEYLRESVTGQLTPEVEAEAIAFYAAFDFMEPDIDLVDIYLRLLEDQVGGYYDPIDKTMNTILITGGELGDDLPLLEETIYAHEFVHALQDQYYNLARLGFTPDAPENDNSDAFLAVQALVEGDASVVMNVYLEQLIEDNPMAAFSILSDSFTSGSLNMPADTPAILTRELLYPYSAGAEFVTALINDGGWDAVDNAFIEKLPASTEQILHPEKYLDDEQPVEVTLNETADALGDGWEQSWENTLGEFYLRSYLNNELTRIDWVPAATGWGGDRYRVHQHENGDLALVLRLAWDTPTDADEFTEAYTLYGDARFASEASDGCWTGADDAVCLGTLDASGETVVTRAPSVEQAQALLDSQTAEQQWASNTQ